MFQRCAYKKLFSKRITIFAFDFPIIYDLGSKIKLFIATLQSYGLQTFAFYRAIYFKERNNVLSAQKAACQQKVLVYQIMQRNLPDMGKKEINDRIENRICICFNCETQVTNVLNLNFREFFFSKYVHIKVVFMSTEDHRCINFSKSFRILYHLIYYICFDVGIHKHLRPWY